MRSHQTSPDPLLAWLNSWTLKELLLNTASDGSEATDDEEDRQADAPLLHTKSLGMSSFYDKECPYFDAQLEGWNNEYDRCHHISWPRYWSQEDQESPTVEAVPSPTASRLDGAATERGDASES